MKIRINLYATAICALMLPLFSAYAQTPGNGEPDDVPTRGEKPRKPDTSEVVFKSPRPLIDPLEAEKRRTTVGLIGALSTSGFGGGVFFQKEFTKNWSYTIDAIGSGARNTDELEIGYNPYTGMTFIPNKINRVFMMPLMLGVQHRVFADKLTDSFRPFVSAGAGPAFILTTPYNKAFFSSFGESEMYTRYGGFLGLGAQVGSSQLKSTTGVSARYYYIPFGGEGIESIKGSPMKDFGGLQLSVFVGF